jgi:uncharacterized protein YlxW (UPF0749 family)
MNLSEKSFTVSSLESDLTAMRKDVNKLQGEINKLDKLLKEMYKSRKNSYHLLTNLASAKILRQLSRRHSVLLKHSLNSFYKMAACKT